MFTKEHIGRTVYDTVNYGEGIITNIHDNGDYPVEVKTHNGIKLYYTIEGKLSKGFKAPTLSFTPYTLQGYTNEIPRSLPEYFEKILVSNDNINWIEKYFNAKIDDKIITADTENVLIAKNETFKYYKRFKEIE